VEVRYQLMRDIATSIAPLCGAAGAEHVNSIAKNRDACGTRRKGRIKSIYINENTLINYARAREYLSVPAIKRASASAVLL